MKNIEERHLITFSRPKSPVAEAFRTLRTNIHFSYSGTPYRTIMITSAGPGEGKSTTLANLGVAMAQAGSQVLIVDCDLRKPVLHKIFEVNNQKGLTNVLVEGLKIEDVIKDTRISNLSVLTSGPVPPNPSELLGSQKMGEFIKELKSLYDIILFDSPPAVAVTDSALLSALVDGVILVLRSGVAKIDMAKHAKEQIEKANGKFIGSVLYGVKFSSADYNYYTYYGEQKNA